MLAYIRATITGKWFLISHYFLPLTFQLAISEGMFSFPAETVIYFFLTKMAN